MAQVLTFIGTSTETSEMRINRIQANRLRLICVLTFMEVIYLTVICMGYYTPIPLWLMVVNVVCVIFNMPLIWWLGSLWWDQRTRENEIREQVNRRR